MNEKISCPKRFNQPGPWELEEGLDAWRRTGPDRTCTFCGCMHPDEFVAFLGIAANPNAPLQFVSCGKPGKFYIRRPDIPNASYGAIKFYDVHLQGTSYLLPHDEERKVTPFVLEFAELLNQALEVGRKKSRRLTESLLHRLHRD